MSPSKREGAGGAFTAPQGSRPSSSPLPNAVKAEQRCRMCRATIDHFTLQLYPGATMCLSCLHDTDDVDGLVRIIERLARRVAELEPEA